jgi:large subunit ribosomal protein L5
MFGNFSFGIKEHIDIPGTKYVPELGIHGMDVTVALSRPGQRVKTRHRAKSVVGFKHRLNPEEGAAFVRDEFGIEVT